MEIDQGQSCFEALVKDVHSRLQGSNEATVRLHFIDKLLEDCLGWPIQDVIPERFHGDDFADYELGSPARRAVIEAKREGEYFELPTGVSDKPVKLKTLFKQSGSAETAISQCIRYCKDRSIPLGAVCNGSQLIVFLGSRQDGIPPENGKAIVFESLESMEERFTQLWNLLSPAGLYLEQGRPTSRRELLR